MSDAAGRRLRVAALVVLAVCVCGIFACDYIVASGIAHDEPGSPNAFLRLYALRESPFLWLLSGFAALVWLLAPRWGGVGAPLQKLSKKSLVAPALMAAAAVTVVAIGGSFAVMQSTRGPGALVNPLLAAISILSLAGASTRLWPGDARRGRLAILYLATSTQFLLVSMTPDAWAAHLSVNLLWLYLVLRDDRFGLAAAPWVGVAALGLQNPLPHALFAAPFLLRVLRTRRIGWIAYYAAAYGAGALALYRWMSVAPAEAGARTAFEVVGLASPERYFVEGLNVSVLLTWQAPAMALFLLVAVLLVRFLKPAERDLLTGLALTFAYYFVFRESNGHDWGYPHVYPVLGTAALLAASATVTIAGQRGGALVPRLVAASAAIALFVQLPLRAAQAQRTPRSPVSEQRMPDTPPPVHPSTTRKR